MPGWAVPNAFFVVVHFCFLLILPFPEAVATTSPSGSLATLLQGPGMYSLSLHWALVACGGQKSLLSALGWEGRDLSAGLLLATPRRDHIYSFKLTLPGGSGLKAWSLTSALCLWLGAPATPLGSI